MISKFYNAHIDAPLSIYHNSDQYDHSLISQLTKESDGQVFIREIPFRSLDPDKFPFVWRVVYAYWSEEDTTVTRFRAFGLDGEHLASASFGVNHGKFPRERRLNENFRHRMEFGREYLHVVDNQILTSNTGGYTCQVLDLLCPSEGIAFGFNKYGNQHRCLVVLFRLFELGEDYPNDLPSG